MIDVNVIMMNIIQKDQKALENHQVQAEAVKEAEKQVQNQILEVVVELLLNQVLAEILAEEIQEVLAAEPPNQALAVVAVADALFRPQRL